MKEIILQLMKIDGSFSHHYCSMLSFLPYNAALSPWLMSMLLWRMKLFRVSLPVPNEFRVCICNDRDRDEIRFMQGWKLRQLEAVLSPWQVRQCAEIRREGRV